jgi:UDP-glucose 4-epimerase
MRGHTHVVHCAAIAGVDTVLGNPTLTMRVNMMGSANVLEAANQNRDGMERVICFSTSEVFGTRGFRSEEGDQTPVGAVGEARWVYAISKLAEEHLAHAYYNQYGLPTVCVRPFNIYGPGQVGAGAIKIFVERAIKDEDIEIHGDGTQIRAWCYVDDMVDGVLLSLEHPNAVGQSFNIGNQRAVVTIYGLAQTVIRVLKSSSKIKYVWQDYTDIELRVPSTKKATELMDFTAQVDLEEGIEKTAQYYRQLQSVG